jgi:N-dimethylarginine dimethylaminohydrolase
MATQLLEGTLPPARSAPCGLVRDVGPWVDSEYGDLHEVLVASPQHLSLVPSNRVSEEALQSGAASCAIQAAAQHAGLVTALRAAGATVQIVATVKGLPDLSFTRDSSFMTPWGLLGLRPGAIHRQAEVHAVASSPASNCRKC